MKTPHQQIKTQLVLLSGGMDSTTALAMAENPRLAVSVDYGQRHVKEIEAAAEIAKFYDVEHLTLDMTGWGALLKGSSLTDRTVEVPEGHYEAPTMALTVVPNRNATMLMAAVGIAQAHGIDEVVTAVHAGDHAVYADCRPGFINAAGITAQLATDGQVDIVAPFIHTSKTGIAELAHEYGAPLHLTWSCYNGRDLHCGKCGTCTERIEAFADAGLDDPTQYEN